MWLVWTSLFTVRKDRLRNFFVCLFFWVEVTLAGSNSTVYRPLVTHIRLYHQQLFGICEIVQQAHSSAVPATLLGLVVVVLLLLLLLLFCSLWRQQHTRRHRQQPFSAFCRNSRRLLQAATRVNCYRLPLVLTVAGCHSFWLSQALSRFDCYRQPWYNRSLDIIPSDWLHSKPQLTIYIYCYRLRLILTVVGCDSFWLSQAVTRFDWYRLGIVLTVTGCDLFRLLEALTRFDRLLQTATCFDCYRLWLIFTAAGCDSFWPLR